MINTVDEQLKTYLSKKPQDLIISNLKWKYLVRAVLRAKNIMIIGPSGCAKTMAAMKVSEVLERPFFKYNLGSTQDARATLIGNTTYRKDTGTIFHKSQFVRAITTPQAIVLLDELTRGTHDAWNILMPVLDPLQRCLRLDEDEDGAVIKVDETVSFIATANIGTEFTATRVLDKATSRRFPIKLEMSPVSVNELKSILELRFGTSKLPSPKRELMDTVCKLYNDIIMQCKQEDSSITTIIPPANIVEIAELVVDGFSLSEISEAAIYPEYPDDGGADSERAFVKSIVQKYIANNSKNPLNDPLKK